MGHETQTCLFGHQGTCTARSTHQRQSLLALIQLAVLEARVLPEVTGGKCLSRYERGKVWVKGNLTFAAKHVHPQGQRTRGMTSSMDSQFLVRQEDQDTRHQAAARLGPSYLMYGSNCIL